MKSAPIVSLFAVAIMVGWFAPSLPTGEIAPDEQSEVLKLQAAQAAQQKRDAGWQTGQTVLKRQADGHFYADATVDGRQYRFLVDTGASIVALTGRDADDMGLYWDETNLRPIGRGASGTVHGVPVRIANLEVGGYEARDVPAAIIPEGLDVSLLGQSFLSQIDNVEISGDEMKLGG